MILKGQIVNLVPMSMDHCNGLLKAGQDPIIWEYLTKKPKTIEDFEKFVKDALNKKKSGCFPFTILTKEGEIIGSTQLRSFNEEHKTIDSSLTWINPKYWGKKVNYDVKYLILNFCFNELKVLRVQYVVDEKNINSQNSLIKLGAIKEGIFRNFRHYPNDLYKNSIIFSHIFEDWSQVKPKLYNMLQTNNEIPNKFWAGGFLYNPKKQMVFLHKRDGNTKFNPNALAFFGGLRENNESPKECFIRELFEEIGLHVNIDDVNHLDDYLNIELDTYRYVFYVVSEVSKEDLTLGEGAGFEWFYLKNVFSEKITEKTERDLRKFVNTIKLLDSNE